MSNFGTWFGSEHRTCTHAHLFVFMLANEWFVSSLLLLTIATVYLHSILCDTKCAHVSVSPSLSCYRLCVCECTCVHVYLQHAMRVYVW